MNQNTSSTPYDDVFRTLATGPERIVIPLINEMFGESLPTRSESATGADNLANEFFLPKGEGRQKKRITDSVIRIWGHWYHIECQSSPDGTMLIRMFEYGSQIALRNREFDEGGTLVVRFPKSGILFLRSTEATPEKMRVRIETPGSDAEYDVEVLRIKDYGLEELFKKELYILLPFYLFVFDGILSKKGKELTDGETELIRRNLGDMLGRLNRALSEGKIDSYSYTTITDMLRKVVEAYLARHEELRKEAVNIMGGTVIPYEARTIFMQGKDEGFSEGRQEGIFETLRSLVQGKLLSVSDAAATAGISEEAFLQRMSGIRMDA